MSQDSDLMRILSCAHDDMRVAALHGLDVLDTPAERDYDDLVWLAAQICDVPIALVSLVDSDRQWFKARVGLEATETPRSMAFCHYAIERSDILEIADAHLDPRFVDNPLVTGAPHIRFYAGAPLVGADGFRYGTLCVIDRVPRTLTATQRDALQRLAARASRSLEQRRTHRQTVGREQTLAQLLEAMPNGVVTCDAHGMLGEFNRAARDWHGVDPRRLPPETWAEHFDLFEADGHTPLDTHDIPLLRAFSGERVRDAQIVIRAAGQAPRRVSCNADALRAPDGALLGAVCVMHDMTELEQVREHAQIEANRFAEAFRNAAEGMALVSLSGKWMDVNPTLCRTLGYAREELLELDFQRLTHPDDLASSKVALAELLTGKRSAYQAQKRYRHKDGHIIQANISVSVLRDPGGKPLQFVTQIQDCTRAHEASIRLRDSERRFRSLLEHSHDAFVAVDEAGVIVEWNRAAEVTFGWRRLDALGKPAMDLIIPAAQRAQYCAQMNRHLRDGDGELLERPQHMTVLHRSGAEFTVESTLTSVPLQGGRVFGAFMRDVSRRIESERRLRESEERLRTVANNVPAFIGHVGRDLHYRFANRPYAEFLGLTPESICGRAMQDAMPAHVYAQKQPYIERALRGEAVSFELELKLDGGGVRHLQVSYIPTRESEGAGGFHIFTNDVTERVRLTRALQERALSDELTGLPNRAAWNAELARVTARATRTREGLAVMFLDLNGFKQVNDTYGHAVGDEVLKEFARRLQTNLRKADFVARLAGDEFVVLLDNLSDVAGDPPLVARKLDAAMRVPMRVDGHAIDIRPSIGIASQTGDEIDAAALMLRADEAMYQAKRGRSVAA